MKKRFAAFGVHLGLSAVILAAPLWLVAVHWFPPPYFSSDGGLRAALLLILVHVAAGPLLTFVVFSPNKSMGKLKFDFVVIGLLQLSALGAGSYTIFDDRPAATVFSGSAFETVSARIILRQGASLGDLESFDGPIPLVYSRPPRTRDEFANMMLLALNEGIDIAQQVKTFKPLNEHLDEVAADQPDLAELTRDSPEFAEELEAFLRQQNARREDFVYIPFNGRSRRILFAIDRSGRLQGSLSRAFLP